MINSIEGFLINLSAKLNGENVILADICSLASHVANKLTQSKEKVFKLSVLFVSMS